MARLPRLNLPGWPQHIIQRGNNQQPIFVSPEQYQFWLDLLQRHASCCAVQVHAYVLLDNHFHLLATPKTADALPRLMQALGRDYVRYFNQTQQRSGTLWEGRYRANVIQPERYLLACMVYLDLKPVQAGLAAQAQDYPWSGCGHHLGLRPARLITPHPLFWQLGNTPFAREAAYAELLRLGIDAAQQAALSRSARCGWVLGDADFVAGLQKATPRRLAQNRPGRPARKV